MNQREFNRQMDSYLRNRKAVPKASFLDKFKSEPPVKEAEPEPEPEPVTEVIVEEATEMDEDMKEFDEERVSFWRRWLNRVYQQSDMEEIEEEVVATPSAIDGDVKDMLKICVQWVNRLPREDLQDIKRSDEYVQFKMLLDKYGLLKK